MHINKIFINKILIMHETILTVLKGNVYCTCILIVSNIPHHEHAEECNIFSILLDMIYLESV
jgi:hypothetical protein